MKDNHNNKTYLIIPEDVIDDLREAVKHLRDMGSKTSKVGELISEEEAKKKLGRETTWFWYMRKKGKLSYTKIGATVFYYEKEIEKLQMVLNQNKSKNGS